MYNIRRNETSSLEITLPWEGVSTKQRTIASHIGTLAIYALGTFKHSIKKILRHMRTEDLRVRIMEGY